VHLAGFELAGLVDRRINAGIGDEFFGRVKALNVADLSQERCARGRTHPGKRGEMLLDLVHELGERVIDALAGSDAIRAVNLATTGNSPGIYGETRSNAGSALRAFATSTTGTTQGVWGQTASTGDNTTAVFGVANATSGHTFGVWGKNQSTDGTGVFGYAPANTGITYGVSGQSDSPDGRGVYGKNSYYDSYGYLGGWQDLQSEFPITTSQGVFGFAAGTAEAIGVEGKSTTGTGVSGWGLTGVSGKSAAGRGVQGESNSGRGVYGFATAQSGLADGVWGRSNSSAGSGVVGEAAGGGFAGYFIGNIQVTGNCTGCNVATFGVNSGDTTLVPGSVVSVHAVKFDEAIDTDPLLVVSQAMPGEGYVGVVIGRAELVQDDGSNSEIPAVPRLVLREGEAHLGDYVVVMTHGIARIKASIANGPILAGEKLTLNSNGQARALHSTEINGVRVSESAPILGVALEQGKADGLLWVLVSPQ
jgi:hypothetical protein